MSIVWIDNFANYGTGTTGRYNLNEVVGITNTNSITYSAPYYYLDCQFGTWFRFSYASPQTTAVLGVRVRPGQSASPMLFFEDIDGADQSQVGLGNDGTINLYDKSGTLRASSDPGACSIGVWTYLELKLIWDTSFEARANGEVIAFDDTGDYSSGTKEISMIALGATGIDYTDLYITDSEYLGEMTVKSYMPDTDATHGDFDPSTGVDHFAVVDEVIPDDDDYLTGLAENDKETFTATPVVEGSIKAVMVRNRVTKVGELAAKIKNLVRVGGVDYLGSDEHYLASDAEVVHQMWENNPDTSSPWAKGELETVEFGLQITGLSTTTTTTTV